jgi:hypothetical protein
VSLNSDSVGRRRCDGYPGAPAHHGTSQRPFAVVGTGYRGGRAEVHDPEGRANGTCGLYGIVRM